MANKNKLKIGDITKKGIVIDIVNAYNKYIVMCLVCATIQKFRNPYNANTKGAKVRAKQGVMGLDDIGMSGLTYECDELIKGKEYTVFLTKFGHDLVPAVLSETNCVFWVEPHNFEVVSMD